MTVPQPDGSAGTAGVLGVVEPGSELGAEPDTGACSGQAGWTAVTSARGKVTPGAA